MGVVNQALPTDRCARLLKINPHNNEQLIGQLLGHYFEASSIVYGSDGIVNGARPHHNNQSVIRLVQHGLDGAASISDVLRQLIIGGHFRDQRLGRKKLAQIPNTKIVNIG